MKKYFLFALILMSCSHNKNISIPSIQRDPSSLETLDVFVENVTSEEDLILKTNELLEKSFYAYVVGQSYLKKFDGELNSLVKTKSHLKSKNYKRLMAIREIVDTVQENLRDIYLANTIAAVHPNYSAEIKDRAVVILKIFDEYFKGVISEENIPKSLWPVVLGNLSDRLTDIYVQLNGLYNDQKFHQNNEQMREKIWDHMVKIRATRMYYYKSGKNLDINLETEKLIKKLSKRKNYKKLLKEIDQIEDSFQDDEINPERAINTDTIYPATDSHGNITGNGFPQNTWTITYDDGPGAKTTPTVLQNLKNKNVKATFFQLAQQVVALPVIAKSIKDAGMEIALHSYTHAQLTKLGDAGLEKEITQAKNVVENKLGTSIKLFRLPYGAGVNNANIRKKIAENKMVHVFWNVDTLDWQDKNPDSIVQRSLTQMKASPKNSGIILFHDIHSQSVIASAKLIDKMKEQKLRICSTGEIVDEINTGTKICQ